MREEAQSFEAIKYSLRQSKDGVVVAFVVQPHDVTPELMALPVGARVMIAWSQIGDDERQIGGGERRSSHPGEKGADREAVPIAAPEPKERRQFHTLPLAQQCAIRCEDAPFHRFLEAHCEGVPYRFIGHGEAAEAVRSLLNIKSRSELGKGNHDADNKWRKLNAEYEAWELDQRYADVRRG